MFLVPEQYRTAGLPVQGNNGDFRKGKLRMRASNGADWEHVSVSLVHRVPSWEEMCWVKDLFWDDEDVVVQYHPRKSEYVNIHPYVLHLWRPMVEVMPLPPVICV
ncbi:MAG: hypothetical protein ACC707_03020 [Thiohalomonadales bacterium]